MVQTLSQIVDVNVIRFKNLTYVYIYMFSIHQLRIKTKSLKSGEVFSSGHDIANPHSALFLSTQIPQNYHTCGWGVALGGLGAIDSLLIFV